MKSFARNICRAGAFAAAFGLCMVAGDMKEAVTSGSFVSQAHAIIGRPLTPLSYAGVARRTTRRAVAAGAVVGAAVAAPVVVAPSPVVVAPARSCVQAVDAYGRIYWRCP
jgi:hypothetical protein